MVLYGFPGLMSYDSVFQLDEARRWDLGDAHPPAMGALWRLCELVVAGPLGMLLLQTVALAVGVYAILKTELSPRRAAIATCCVCWAPPVLVVMGVIWKDPQMAGYALLGIAALRSPRRSVRYAGLGALCLASAMRHNAAAATFAPVLVLWATDEPVALRRWASRVAAWLAITAAAFGLNAMLVQHHQDLWASSVGVTDLAGIVRFSDVMSDADARELLAGTRLRPDHDLQRAISDDYDPHNYLEYNQHEHPLDVPITDDQRAAVARAWRTAVLEHPLAYLHHRWMVFRRVLNVRGATYARPVMTSFAYQVDPALASRVSHDASPSLIQRAWFAFARGVPGVLYVPFVYFVVALCLLPLARSRLVYALLGSGLGYELGYFPFAMNGDYRYSHWLIASTIVAAVLVFARRYRTGRPTGHGARTNTAVTVSSSPVSA